MFEQFVLAEDKTLALLESRIELLKAQQDIIEMLPDNYDVELTNEGITVNYQGISTTFKYDGKKFTFGSKNLEVSDVNHWPHGTIQEAARQLQYAHEVQHLLIVHGYNAGKLIPATTNCSQNYGQIPGWAIFVKHEKPFCIHIPVFAEPGIVILDKYKEADDIQSYDYPEDDVNHCSLTPQEIIDDIIQYKPPMTEGLKQAIAAGTLAAATLIGGSTGGHPAYIDKGEHSSEVKRHGARSPQSFKTFSIDHEKRAKTLAAVITNKYSVSSDMALKVAKLALKHEKPIFPKAEDILAVCGIESSFKPGAASQLKNDPAIGLMQVRPAVWKLDKAKLQGSAEEQIRVGSEILHGYYVKLKSKESALQAYNVGITNYLKKKGLNPRYVPKFKNERDMYETPVKKQ